MFGTVMPPYRESPTFFAAYVSTEPAVNMRDDFWAVTNRRVLDFLSLEECLTNMRVLQACSKCHARTRGSLLHIHGHDELPPALYCFTDEQWGEIVASDRAGRHDVQIALDAYSITLNENEHLKHSYRRAVTPPADTPLGYWKLSNMGLAGLAGLPFSDISFYGALGFPRMSPPIETPLKVLPPHPAYRHILPPLVSLPFAIPPVVPPPKRVQLLREFLLRTTVYKKFDATVQANVLRIMRDKAATSTLYLRAAALMMHAITFMVTCCTHDMLLTFANTCGLDLHTNDPVEVRQANLALYLRMYCNMTWEYLEVLHSFVGRLCAGSDAGCGLLNATLMTEIMTGLHQRSGETRVAFGFMTYAVRANVEGGVWEVVPKPPAPASPAGGARNKHGRAARGGAYDLWGKVARGRNMIGEALRNRADAAITSAVLNDEEQMLVQQAKAFRSRFGRTVPNIIDSFRNLLKSDTKRPPILFEQDVALVSQILYTLVQFKSNFAYFNSDQFGLEAIVAELHGAQKNAPLTPLPTHVTLLCMQAIVAVSHFATDLDLFCRYLLPQFREYDVHQHHRVACMCWYVLTHYRVPVATLCDRPVLVPAVLVRNRVTARFAQMGLGQLLRDDRARGLSAMYAEVLGRVPEAEPLEQAMFSTITHHVYEVIKTRLMR